MPRATKDARLDSRRARAGLPARKKPHYRLIEAELHVGYYRGAKGGSWIARRYTRKGAYTTTRLGLADNGREADGTEVLTFSQAQRAAREWATREAARSAGKNEEPSWTVAEAVAHYLDDYRARGGKALSYMETTFKAHILPRLGEKKLDELTPALIRSWHHGLANAPPRLRTPTNTATRRTRKLDPDDADAHRARRATANGILTMLKAALNLAYREGRVVADDAWRRVRPFQKVAAARIRYLTDDEARRLLNASRQICDG